MASKKSTDKKTTRARTTEEDRKTIIKLMAEHPERGGIQSVVKATGFSAGTINNVLKKAGLKVPKTAKRPTSGKFSAGASLDSRSLIQEISQKREELRALVQKFLDFNIQ
jgi:DNA invertase Pin-like site-specific DNA recombinase